MRAVHAARPYWFEVFILVNLVAIEVLLRRIGTSGLPALPRSLVLFAPSFLLQLAIGVGIRALLKRRAYLDAIRSRDWIVDSVRLLFFTAAFAAGYAIF